MSVVNVNEALGEGKVNKFHVSLFFLICLAIAIEGYDLFIYGGTLPILMELWKISPEQAGILGSMASLGMLIGAVVIGWLADIYGRKKALLVCMLLYGLGAVCTGFSSNATQVGIFRFVTGLGAGATTISALALLAEYAPFKNRAFLMGSVSAAFPIGGVLSAFLSMWLIPAYSWQGPYFFAAALLVISVPLVIKVMPETPAFYLKQNKTAELRAVLQKARPDLAIDTDTQFEVTKENCEKASAKAIFQDKRLRSTLMIWIVFFMCEYTTYGISSWLPKLMMGSGFTFTSSLLFLLTVNLGGSLGILFCARLADRYGQKRLLYTFMIISLVCLPLLAYTTNVVTVAILMTLVGAGFFGATGLMFAYTSLFYPASIRGTGSGFASGFSRLGAMSGPTVMGFLIGMQLPQSNYFYLLSLPMVLALIALIFIQEKYSASYREIRSRQESSEEGLVLSE